MVTEFGYTLAFLTGIAGAFHCLGMCGGFASGYFAGHGWAGTLLPHALYHGSRILAYTLLGTAGAVVGQVLVQAGVLGKFQGLLFMLAGVCVIAIGLWFAGLLPWPSPAGMNSGCSGNCRVHFGERPRAAHRLPILSGIVNGLVPCSLVFSVAVKAAATADPLQAGLLMFAFGLGTLPTMLLVTIAGAVVGEKARGLFSRLAGWLICLFGSWTFYEGLVFYDIMRGLANF